MLDFFSKKGNEDSEEIVLIEDKMPKHIAIIMDGNGRWAKKRGLPRTMGTGRTEPPLCGCLESD